MSKGKRNSEEERAFHDLMTEVIFHLVNRHGKEAEDIFCRAVMDRADLEDLREEHPLTDHDIDVLNRLQIAYALQAHANKLVMDALEIERKELKRLTTERTEDTEKDETA